MTLGYTSKKKPDLMQGRASALCFLFSSLYLRCLSKAFWKQFSNGLLSRAVVVSHKQT